MASTQFEFQKYAPSKGTRQTPRCQTKTNAKKYLKQPYNPFGKHMLFILLLYLPTHPSFTYYTPGFTVKAGF